MIISKMKHFKNDKIGTIDVHVSEDVVENVVVLSKSKYTPKDHTWGIVIVENLSEDYISHIDQTYTIEQIDYHYYVEVADRMNNLLKYDNLEPVCKIKSTSSGDPEKMHRIIFLMKKRV